MRTYVLRCEMLTKCSLRETFEVFEDPQNLSRITPAWLNFKVVSQSAEMRKGAEMDYIISWLGLPMRWKTLITEYEPPFLFVDEQTRGPYHSWKHRHTFEPSNEGTRVGDRVEYSLPLGPLGQVAHAAIVKRQLTDVFEFRQRELTKIFGGRTVQLSEPAISVSSAA
jgi:ligand-binding SRPBCC domain-containing protein